MKVFQELRTAITEWEDSRSLIISITRILGCDETEIIDKIEQLREARPASDLRSRHKGGSISKRMGAEVGKVLPKSSRQKSLESPCRRGRWSYFNESGAGPLDAWGNAFKHRNLRPIKGNERYTDGDFLVKGPGHEVCPGKY